MKDEILRELQEIKDEVESMEEDTLKQQNNITTQLNSIIRELKDLKSFNETVNITVVFFRGGELSIGGVGQDIARELVCNPKTFMDNIAAIYCIGHKTGRQYLYKLNQHNLCGRR